MSQQMGGGGAALTFGAIRTWHAGPIDQAADQLKTKIDQLVRAGDTFETGSTLPSCSGDTKIAAITRRNRLLEQGRRHVATATTVYRGLADAAGELTGLEAGVRDVQAQAAAQQLSIGDDGAVHDLRPPSKPADMTDPHAQIEALANERARQQTITALTNRVNQLLQQADAIDTRLTNVLLHGMTGTDDGNAGTLAQAQAVGGTALATALASSGFTSVPTDPAQVKTFWTSLSAAERTALINEDPQRWGNLDGVPTTDRDRANQKNLARDLADGKALFARHGLKTPEYLADFDRLDDRTKDMLGAEAVQRYRNAVAINTQLVAHKDLPTFLHTYDAGAYGGDGRGAIAFGNPDTATNLAVSVPGLTSRADNMGAVTEDVANLYKSAAREAPGQKTAVIGWIGYDAPDLSSLAEKASVTRQDKAAAGAKELASAVRGLRANFTGSGKLTVIGHSYGSTTTALALQNEHLADSVDQAVLIGSPGVGGSAHNVSDLHLKQLYVGAASHDKVSSMFDGLGDNPANQEFGATRFRAENVHRGHVGETPYSGWSNFSWPSISDKTGSWFKGDHTAYYDIDTQSESLASLTYITTGQADQLGSHHLLADPRTQDGDPEGDRTPEGAKMPWMNNTSGNHG